MEFAKISEQAVGLRKDVANEAWDADGVANSAMPPQSTHLSCFRPRASRAAFNCCSARWSSLSSFMS